MDGTQGGPAVRRRALRSVALVGGRELAARGVALAGNVAVARLLAPADFGLVAFGLALLSFAETFSDGGLGVGLIRRSPNPTRTDLEVLLGMQLTVALVIAGAVSGVAMAFGRAGTVTAIMMAALPVMALQTPTTVVLERDLRYVPIVRAEVLQEVAYYVWAVAGLALGAGVWGLASASIVKAIVGSGVLLAMSPVPLVRPRSSWRHLRPLLRFGLQYQAVQVVNTIRDQGLNVLTAVLGGLPILGLWTLTRRVMLAPFLLFGALWRVSYPSMVKLLSAGEQARPLVEQGVSLAAVGSGFILAPLAGSASAFIPVAFGARWDPVAPALPPICLGLQIAGPVSVATAGYLYARGDTSTVLRSALILAAVWLAVGLGLLPTLGVVGLGLGWMAASLVESLILARATSRRTAARLGRPLVSPLCATVGAGVLGWLVPRAFGDTPVSFLLAVMVSLTSYAVAVLVLCRPRVRTLVRLVLQAGRSLVPSG